jgi:hypothetical protein
MATTVTRVANNAWSDLGTGNRQIQALDFDVYIALGASAPAASAIGFVLNAGDECPIMTLTTTGHIYARAVSTAANIVDAPTT